MSTSKAFELSRPTVGPLWFMTALLLSLLIILVSTPKAQEAHAVSDSPYPMNVMEDSASFTFYINEEVLVESHCLWQTSGAFSSDYSLSVGGQTVNTTMNVKVDKSGSWTGISMMTPGGLVTVVRQDTLAIITGGGQTNTVRLRPGTILFENFSPALMSQAVAAYDQKAGGKQSFPIFVIPSVVMDATLERLEPVQREVGGENRTFARYLYGLPGVDVTLYVDDANRICFGDVPGQHGAYVRAGYEALREKPGGDTLLSKAEYEVKVDKDIQVPMRDGLSLATDIYRPDVEGKPPVILVRTPYKKELNELQGKFFARRGYIYAVQDCRGRFSSPGTWTPFFNEPNDGYDAIEWLAAQPWSNGKVGMIGASYLGWVQWMAARNRPPHLTTMIPNVSPPDPYFNIPYEHGPLFLWGAIWWADVLEQDATADISGEAMRKILDKDYNQILKHLPVIELDSIVLGKKNAYWRDWIAHPDNDDYWDRASFLTHIQDLDIPVYHQSGWYDGDGIGSKLNYAAMKSFGHGNQKLVLGPWGHTDKAMRLGPGMVDFGPNAIVDLETSYVRWLDHWLMGIDNGIDKEPLVSLFVMGSDKWLEGSQYPLPETKFIKYYLASGGSANTSKGDGRLSASLPGGKANDTFTYDPGDPTPDPSFAMAMDKNSDAEGDSTKAKSVEEELAKRKDFYGKIDRERKDILVYETEPAKEPLTIAGPISAVLYASTSAKDTDWHMRLSMVSENGDIFPLVHGCLRARYHNSFSKPELLETGKIYEFDLDLWQTGITILPGQKLRVEVASCSFPLFSRNLNTGGHSETETKYISAHQTIYHDAENPSYILLPVIPNPDFKDTTLGK